MRLTEIDLEHIEDNTTTYQAYLTNLLHLLPSHTSKVFLPKSIWTELTNKVKKAHHYPQQECLPIPAQVLRLP